MGWLEPLRIVRAPLEDVRRALEAVTADSPWGLAAAGLGYVASWWLYVPLHELLHAWGCMATGGSVSRLEIDGMYGAALLRRLFPFVAVGSAYAGQLTGFDTRGSDARYLATDAAPFLLTVFLAIPALEWALRARRSWPLRAAVLGAALPAALAPFLSIGGDYYEMGSIVVTRAAAIAHPSFDVGRWRSDDVVKLATALLGTGPARAGDALGLAAGAALGGVLTFATYAAGKAWSRWLTTGLVRRRARPPVVENAG